jgi:hypothetical protein
LLPVSILDLKLRIFCDVGSVVLGTDKSLFLEHAANIMVKVINEALTAPPNVFKNKLFHKICFEKKK